MLKVGRLICMYKSLLTSIDDNVVLMVMMIMVMAMTAVFCR